MPTTFRSTSQGTIAPGSIFSEAGIVEHNGQTFASGGATITDDYVIAYLAKNSTVTTWEGKRIGAYRITKSWRTARSWVSSHMHQVYLTLDDGRSYTGRSAGEGMIVKARRLAKERKTA